MTHPLPPPKRKDPTRRTRQPTLPPANRSREAQQLTALAAIGRFALQTCAECETVHYPPRQICAKCLADTLEWRDVPAAGELLAETTLHHSNDSFFRERLPWRLGVVRMDAGPSVVAHLAKACARGARVRLSLNLDRSGHAVMMAVPEAPSENLEDDLQLRELTSDPSGRRALVADGKTDLGLALVHAFADAGARTIFVGHAEPWKASEHLHAAKALPGVQLFPLDVTDTDSVKEVAALIGDKVEIMVNNSYHLRAGGATTRLDLNTTRAEMEIHYFGLLRLAGTFGPAMRARGADGQHGAVAWVNVLSAYALVNNPAFGTYSASQAAAFSAAQCMRSEMTNGGVRVVNAFLGPLDDEWHQLVPPPKLDPGIAARRIVEALRRGHEDVPIGAIAEEIVRRMAENPKEIERNIRR